MPIPMVLLNANFALLVHFLHKLEPHQQVRAYHAQLVHMLRTLVLLDATLVHQVRLPMKLEQYNADCVHWENMVQKLVPLPVVNVNHVSMERIPMYLARRHVFHVPLAHILPFPKQLQI